MHPNPNRRLVELHADTFPSEPFGGQSPADDDQGVGTMDATQLNLVKVFSATKSKDRERLGDRVTAWLAENPTVVVLRTTITQSSDAGFHCLTFVLFCALAA